ncbi:MAG: pyruvate kinase [Phycisphaerales bacterium]
MSVARILTKIVATLGPASSDDVTIEKLVEAGVGVFRLNFSHGSLDDHAKRLAGVRRVSAKLGRVVGVLGDLQGPKIRVGRIDGGGASLAVGDEVHFVRGDLVAESAARPLRLASTYARLVDDVRPGERVLIDDGSVRLLAAAHDGETLRCLVTTGGTISSGKGINLPESQVTATALSERDLVCVAWAVEHELDYLALSFVRSAGEIIDLRLRIGTGVRLPIVAKIERPEAVEEIEPIVEASDAIMVARGDLGVEMDFAKVPLVQIRLVEAAHAAGKPCIVATQMLQSMIDAPMPTRAEATDVANAILQGADAVMLSGETAVGKWPVLTVETMRRIAAEAERFAAERSARGAGHHAAPAKLVATGYRTAALAHGVWYMACDNRATCVVVWSQQGGGARYLSQNDFAIPIVAFSSDERAVRRMTLLRGVFPARLDPPATVAAWRAAAAEHLRRGGFAKPGDRAVLVFGEPLGVAGVTDSVALVEV